MKLVEVRPTPTGELAVVRCKECGATHYRAKAEPARFSYRGREA